MFREFIDRVTSAGERPERSRRQVLARLLFLPLCLALVLLGGARHGWQMESVFGLPRPGGEPVAPAFWSLEPAPAGLRLDSSLPPLRVVTYNLHSGLGPDWSLRAARPHVEERLRLVARSIAAAAPAAAPVDAVGLNEVDFGSRRSGWFDQADFLAAELRSLTGTRYEVVRGETWRREVPGLEVRFGNALLVRHPVVSAHACELGGPCSREASASGPPPAGNLLSRLLGEPRGIVKATVDFHGRPLDLLVTHLEAFVLQQRETQAAELLDRHVDSARPTVLLGDINAVPAEMTAARNPFAADRTHDILTSGRLIDARVALASRAGRADLSAWATFPSDQPAWPLDAALASEELLAQEGVVIGGEASDHRGLAVTYRWLGDSAAADQLRWRTALQRRQLERIVARDFALPGPDREMRAGWLAAGTGFGDLAAEILARTKIALPE